MKIAAFEKMQKDAWHFRVAAAFERKVVAARGLFFFFLVLQATAVPMLRGCFVIVADHARLFARNFV